MPEAEAKKASLLDRINALQEQQEEPGEQEQAPKVRQRARITGNFVKRLEQAANRVPATEEGDDALDIIGGLISRLEAEQEQYRAPQARPPQARQLPRPSILPRQPTDTDLEMAGMRAEIERLEARVEELQQAPAQTNVSRKSKGFTRRGLLLGGGLLAGAGVVAWLLGKQDVTESRLQKERRLKVEEGLRKAREAQAEAQDKIKYITSFVTGQRLAVNRSEFNAAVAKSFEPFALAYFRTKGNDYKDKPLLDLRLTGNPVSSDSRLTVEFIAEMMGAAHQNSPATLKFKLEIAVNDPRNPTQLTLSRASVEEWLAFRTGLNAWSSGEGRKRTPNYSENLFSPALTAIGLDGTAILDAIKTVTDAPNSAAVKEMAARNLSRSEAATKSCQKSAARYRTCPHPAPG